MSSPKNRIIRRFEESDMDDVLDIWLQASVLAHSFVGRSFWESKLDDMRNLYIPASETYLLLEQGKIQGFVSLVDETLAALFVLPTEQGKGVGQQLMRKAKSLKNSLNLTVYKENARTVHFYKACGFAVMEERIDEHTGHVEYVMKYNA